MNLRGLLLALGAVVLCAATEPPAPLAPYVKDGRLDPGDYGWIKGRFDDATPQPVRSSAPASLSRPAVCRCFSSSRSRSDVAPW